MNCLMFNTSYYATEIKNKVSLFEEEGEEILWGH